MIDHANAALNARLPQVKGQVRLKKATWSSYFGSVRFFKHLIIGVVLLMLTAPWVLVSNMAGSGEKARSEKQMLESRFENTVETLESELIMTKDELQSALRDYDAMVNLADSADSEKLLLMDQLERAESLLSFESSYGYLHPELRTAGPDGYVDSAGVIYLTFDDGPGKYTRSVLDILKRYDVKATFFIVGYVIDGREDMLRRIVEEGHNLGIHTYSHVYREIYSSLEAYLDDFARVSDKIEEITGIRPDVFRFPGGSINSYNETWGNTIISEMLGRGYRYYDWNVGSGDTGLDVTANDIYEAVIRQVHSNSYSVALMHDGGGGREPTIESLPMIIDRLLREGYRFDRLTNQVRPTVFSSISYSRG